MEESSDSEMWQREKPCNFCNKPLYRYTLYHPWGHKPEDVDKCKEHIQTAEALTGTKVNVEREQ